jgi:PAS domain S-box-containing protein
MAHQLDQFWMRSVLEHADDAIVTKTLDGRVTFWNRGAERMFGFTAVEMIGQPIFRVVPPERHPEEHDLLDRLGAGERIAQYETVRRHRDGTPVPVSITLSPVRDQAGTVVGASSIARDIAERVQQDAERQHLLVRERAARRAAEEANRAKEEFLATLSHELRTPLNAVAGWARMLRTGALDAARASHALEVIERNVEAQATMIADLLDMSRIVTGHFRIEPQRVALEPVLRAAIEAVAPTAEIKRIALEVAPVPDVTISGDARRLQQVFWNLLVNAVKFTATGGRVEVEVKAGAGSVDVWVSDDGIGIAPDLLPYVFERFRQGDTSPTRMTGGLGLGLAIVRHVVELHGGSVSATSGGEGRGARFGVRLPLASPGSARTAHRGPAASETQMPANQA